MNIYNKTRCPVELLTRFFEAAANLIGCRSDGVAIKVTRSRSLSPGAAAQFAPDGWVKLQKLTGKREHCLDYVDTDGGFLKMKLPALGKGAREFYERFPEEAESKRWCWLDIAQDWFNTCLHEWGHVFDYQAGGRETMAWSTNDLQYKAGGRRMNWTDRPEEIRARAYQREAAKKIGPVEEEVIIEMAVWLEENQGF